MAKLNELKEREGSVGVDVVNGGAGNDGGFNEEREYSSEGFGGELVKDEIPSGVVRNYVYRESFVLRNKRYWKYFIKDVYHGRDVRVDLNPPGGKDDIRGYEMLAFVFNGGETADFMVGVSSKPGYDGKRQYTTYCEVFSEIADPATGELERVYVRVIPSGQSNRVLLSLILAKRGIKYADR
jgi:hypothetical protein